MSKEPLTADELGSLTGDVQEAWRRAVAEFGKESGVARLLDIASGNVDTAWDILRQMEREEP